MVFEQTSASESVDLADVHPMNLASVIKLYLRRLPEPLLTYELYDNWLEFEPSPPASEAGVEEPDEQKKAAIEGLRALVDRLPEQNHDTLQS